MAVGVPAYQLVVDIVIAAALLLGVCYLPLVLQRNPPRWLQFSAVAVALVLAGGVVFALLTGHWPFRE